MKLIYKDELIEIIMESPVWTGLDIISRIDAMATIDNVVTCKECRYWKQVEWSMERRCTLRSTAYHTKAHDFCSSGKPQGGNEMRWEELKYLGDDITFCTAKCETPCRRKPEYIRLKDRPHSFADFSKNCMAYEPKEER